MAARVDEKHGSTDSGKEGEVLIDSAATPTYLMKETIGTKSTQTILTVKTANGNTWATKWSQIQVKESNGVRYQKGVQDRAT